VLVDCICLLDGNGKTLKEVSGLEWITRDSCCASANYYYYYYYYLAVVLLYHYIIWQPRSPVMTDNKSSSLKDIQ